MLIDESRALARRVGAGVANTLAWRHETLARWQPDVVRLNQILQGVSLLLVALVALPLAARNVDALTRPLTDVLEGRSRGGDFIAFYAAGRLYDERRDASPYDLDELRRAEFELDPTLRTSSVWDEERVNPYRNPPFYLPVLGYFAGFSLPVAFALTTLVQGVFLALLLTLTAGLVAGRGSPIAAITWVFVGLAYYHVWVGFNYAQLPAYLVALSYAGGILLLRAGLPLWSGLVFSLLWLKLQYLPPVLLFLVVMKCWRPLLGIAIGSLVLLLLSLAVVGADGLLAYVQTLIHLATAPSSQYFVNYEWMFNWRGLLERALPDSPAGVIFGLQTALTLLTYGLAIWAWKADARGSPARSDGRIVVLTFAMVLASPHVHGQDMLLLLPAGAIMARYLWDQAMPWMLTAISALGLLLFFWVVPQQVLITPLLNFSVLLLVFVFLGSVAFLRDEALIQPAYRGSMVRSP